MTHTAGHACVNEQSRPRAGCSPLMGDQQFAAWLALLEARAGLFIGPERKSFLLSGLRARMRELGCKGYDEYYRQLVAVSPDAEEWALLIDRLTVHETCFFRHESSMRLVQDVVLPAAIAHETDFKVLSVGCSTGEEAYSLAMLTDSWCRQHNRAQSYTVTGTDISMPSLQHARAGIYLRRRLRDISHPFQSTYCDLISDKRFAIKDGLRERVSFLPFNLRDLEQAPFAGIDLVFCQNLLIYYERERRLDIVSQLAGLLSPGGVLVLGPGEVLGWQHPDMEKVRYDDTLAYRRVA